MLRELIHELGRSWLPGRQRTRAREAIEFTVLLVRPAGYLHTEVFREIAETVCHGLGELGLHAVVAENGIAPGSVPIVLGSHLLREANVAQLPDSAILYNFEQIHAGVPGLQTFLRVLAPRFHVWDYSRRNIATLRSVTQPRSVVHVPLGYAPALSRVAPAPEQDIDVFFSGALSERRQRVLQELRDAGLAVVSVSQVYGAERDALIARSKIVLNMHYREETRVLEIARIFYLLANRKAVLTECGPDTEIEERLRPALRAVPCAQLVAAARELVADAVQRAELERRGYEIFTAASEAEILGRALDETMPGLRSGPHCA